MTFPHNRHRRLHPRLDFQSGFTLIEVMVALAILAALSLLTAQAMRSGISNKMIMQTAIERETLVTDALRIIRADITAAFHHRDIAVAMYNEIVSPPKNPNPNNPQQNPAPGAPPANPNPPNNANNQNQQTPQVPLGTPRPTPIPMTGFSGDPEALYFTTLNHTRTIRDAKESDQAKVGYYVKSCKTRRGNKEENTRCLFRSLSTQLDGDVTQTGPESILVENVEEFKLRYLGPGQDDYVDTWKTGQNGVEGTRDKFPYAVEVTLTVHDKNDKKEKPYSQTILVPIRFPNNEPNEEEKKP